MKKRSIAIAAACCGLVLCASSHARVTRIVIDEAVAMPPAAGASDIAYEQVAGRAFGELDPKLPGNAIIQDIELAKDADGKVRYVASFVIYKPVDLGKASGLMWHDVPNRGRVFPFAPQERAFGDIMLASAWQGDNSGATKVRPTASAAGMQFLQVPVARGPGGAPVTGEVFGRIVNRSGMASQPLLVQTNPVPYKPVNLDTTRSKLVSRGGENMRGEVFDEVTIPASDWAWAKCDASNPFPGKPDPTQICLKNGFDPARLYQVVFTAADPYVLGIGFAAWRGATLAPSSRRREPMTAAHPIPSRAASRTASRAAFHNRAITCAAGCTWASTRTRPVAACTTACGRSSRDVASP